LFTRLLRRAGPLLALALVAAAAVASLFGLEPVQRLVGSTWFLVLAGLVAGLSLLAGIIAVTRGEWPGILLHLGLVIGLTGVGLNQLPRRGGYLLLEPGQVSNLCLSSNLRLVQELPFEVGLDSITERNVPGFRTTPVAWLKVGDRRTSVTFNEPLDLSGCRVLLARIVDRGFLVDYELEINGQEYVLLHNQHVDLPGGGAAWSFATDVSGQLVALMVNGQQKWLASGDSAIVRGVSLRMGEATFTSSDAAILVLNDVRLRFIIYVGFGLALLGLVPPLLRSRRA